MREEEKREEKKREGKSEIGLKFYCRLKNIVFKIVEKKREHWLVG